MVTHHPVDLPCPGPSAVPVVLSQDERTELKARAQSPDRRRAERARIVLACADGLSNMGAARSLGVAVKTVAKWRRRFAAEGWRGSTTPAVWAGPRRIWSWTTTNGPS